MAHKFGGSLTGGDGGHGTSRVSLTDADREVLRRVARDSIEQGLRTGEPLKPDLSEVSPPLRDPGAVFVTLNRNGRLRGCVGSLEARRPLVQEVARSAYSAAFNDHRFPPLSDSEFPGLDIHISLLTPLEPLRVEDRAELFERLRPGEDGLLLEDPPYKSTFLPQVWDSLPKPADFLAELLLKAGLPPDHWSNTLSFHRYGVEEF